MSETPISYSAWTFSSETEKSLKEWYVVDSVTKFIENNNREPNSSEYETILNSFNFTTIIGYNKPLFYADYYVKIYGVEPPQPATYVIVYVDGVSTQYEVSPNDEDVNLWDSNNRHYTKASQLTNGASYTAIAPESGTTGITDGHKWIQLFEGGAKWAVCNYGAVNDEPSDLGTYYKPSRDGKPWTAWGSNWRMPTKNDLTEFYNAARSIGANVSCTYNGNYNQTNTEGFVFAGTGGEYINNAIFVPASTIGQYNDSIDLWTSTITETKPNNTFVLWLAYSKVQQTTSSTNFNDGGSDYMQYWVRPVLNE